MEKKVIALAKKMLPETLEFRHLPEMKGGVLIDTEKREILLIVNFPLSADMRISTEISRAGEKSPYYEELVAFNEAILNLHD